MNAGWVITQDHIADTSEPEGSNCNAKGIAGPRTYEGPMDTTALPIPFKLYDDDGELYYTGRMNEAAMDEFGESDPLHCFGLPNAGAVTLKYREEGVWKVL
jgi:hypothetical protein